MKTLQKILLVLVMLFASKAFGTVTYVDFDPNGNLVQSSGDATHHWLGLWTGSVFFNDADASPTVAGELRYDNTLTGLQDGGIVWYDDDQIRYIVDLAALPSDDDYVIAYDADADNFYMKADSGGFTQEQIEDYVGAMVTGNTETLIVVTYDDPNGEFDFVVDNDLHNYSWTNVDATDLKTGSVTQAYDATLLSIAALGTAADKMLYTTNTDVWAETDLTSFGRSILDDADEATFKATVNLEVDVDFRGYEATVTYFGDDATNGSWRITKDSNDLAIERREGGSWIMKLKITAD